MLDPRRIGVEEEPVQEIIRQIKLAEQLLILSCF